MSNETQNAPVEAEASGEGMEEKTGKAIEQYIRAWAESDRDAFLQVFADDAIWIDPVGTPPYEGLEAIAGFWDRAHDGEQTLRPDVERIVVCGNEGVLLFRMNVRNPDGSGMTLSVCDQMIVNDRGQIVSAKAYWDSSCVTMVAASES